MFDSLFESVIVRARSAVELAQTQRAGVVWRPLRDAAVAHKIAVIFEKFFLARARRVREFNLGFLGSCRSLAAFENILFPRTRGLDHLLASAIKFAEEPVAEMKRSVIDNERLLIREQVLVTTVGWDEFVGSCFWK